MKRTLKRITPGFLISFYHFFLSFLGALRYGFPSKRITVVGITGTNGKTTTVDLIRRILEQKDKTASASSIEFRIGENAKENKLKMTMPGRFFLQKFLRKAVKEKCKYAVLEVTSEGVLQHRHRFIDFDVAVFTNLSPEHIERHGSFENYREAKGKFFKKVKGVHIINLDDENSGYFLQFPCQKKIGYSAKENPKAVTASNIKALQKGISFWVQHVNFELNLVGKFNVYNALAAICVGSAFDISLEKCKKALERAQGIPGRMEQIFLTNFKVVVDYAFTPNALKQVYETLGESLVCVLGACGGGRDKWKRKVLGQIADRHCSKVIITNEDPYDEDPWEIIKQVGEGSQKAEKILDRREAISKALSSAKHGDTVVITGKGCEPWICVANGKKIPWDDRKVVRQEAEKLGI